VAGAAGAAGAAEAPEATTDVGFLARTGIAIAVVCLLGATLLLLGTGTLSVRRREDTPDGRVHM
jgi:hypothetical protein